LTPTVRDCTPTVGDDPDLWDVAFDGSGRSGRFGPLRFGPLEPSDEALLRLLLSKREVGRRDVAAVLRRPSEHISLEAAVGGLRLRLPLLVAARIVRVGDWGFRYRRPLKA